MIQHSVSTTANREVLDQIALVHIGRVPPPVGGVTIHCLRINDALLRSGLQSRVVSRPQALRMVLVRRTRGWLGRLTGEELTSSASDPVFILHFSSPDSALRAIALAMYVRMFGARLKPILVPHCGSIPQLLAEATTRGRAARSAFRSAAGILAFSRKIESAVSQIVSIDCVQRGSSFVPDLLIDQVREEKSTLPVDFDGPPTILSSGYRNDVYGFLELLQLLQRCRLAGHTKAELHLYVYGETDRSYWEEFTRRCQSLEGVKVVENRSPDCFLRALRRASVYVRNTSHDSYGVAVAEALYLGVPSVATNVCDRPDGALLFGAGDVEALSSRVLEVLGRPPSSERESLNWGESGLDSYRRLIELVVERRAR